ncbi:unnamed protein product [Rotaria sp. Silwood1]|nr:unnamed protein product [Rotaria sp. Silwood1]
MKQYHVYQLEYFDLLAQASSRRQVVVKKIIVDSFPNTGNKWKSLSQLIVDVYFVHLQSYITISSSKGQSLLNISSTQLTLFGIVSSVELQPIDPCVVAFRSFSNRNDINGQTIN